MIDNLESTWAGPADGPATAERFVRWLETGADAAGVFAADVFGHVTLPLWRCRPRPPAT
jgi:hypothetical protein